MSREASQTGDDPVVPRNRAVESEEEAAEDSIDASFDSFLREVAQAPMPLRLPRPGEWLGGKEGRRFEVLEKIGIGGMGQVFRARDQELQRVVALKFLLPREQLADLALLEARAIARLDHEHIVRIFDVGEWIPLHRTTRIPFLVMECLEGESLAALMRRGRVEPKRALEVLEGILSGLAHAHAHHVIHRDLKPSNVFLTRQGPVKLLDFGLAHLTAAGGPSQALHLPSAGTPAYMAPEQWEGTSQDARTDLWTTGVVLYEMLTGELPWPYATLEELRHQVVSGEPAPLLRTHQPELPRELESFVAMALAKEPEKRFQSAREMAEELKDLRTRLGFLQGEPRARVPRRRQVTLVCCLLTGTNGTAEPLDVDALGELEAAFHRKCVDIIRKHGGSITLYLGRQVLASFGSPQMREDDAECAVRAALLLASSLPRALQRILPHLALGSLAAKVGVHTDLMVLGEHAPDPRERAVAIQGEAPQVAEWLARQAAPGEVLVGGTTWRLVGGSFATEPRGSHSFEGLAGTMSLETWRVVREREALSRFNRARTARGLTPLVGREDELRRLSDGWERARAGQGGCVLLIGEAGIGKSRVLQELLERIPPKTSYLLPAQCWPRFSSGALLPGFEVFKHHLLHVSPESSPRTQLTELETRLGGELGMSQEHVQLIGLFLHLPVAEDALVRQLTPERRRELTFEALETLLRRMSKDRPVLVTVEDMHWADSFLLELFDYLLEHIERERILIVLTARPEFQPPWPPRPWLHRMVLDRLGPELATDMVKAAAGGKALPTELVHELARRSDGIPLFIEEMMRMVLERGGRPELPGTLPATLHELLLARLDLIPTRQRALVRMCSVVGRDFSLSLLLVLTRADESLLKRELAGLIRGGLFQEHREPTRAREPMFRFRHALLQEAAYASLSWRERRHYHRRLARVLLERFGHEVESCPELIAHHLTAAGNHEEAISWWLRAGQLAQTRSAGQEAVAHLTQALTLLRGLPDASQRATEELRILLALGPPLYQQQGFGSPEAERTYTRIWELFEQLGDALPPQQLSYGGMFSWHYARAEISRCHALGERLVRLGERHSSPELLTQGYRFMAYDLLMRGRARAAMEYAERAVSYRTQAGHEPSYFQAELQWVDPRVAALVYAPVALSLMGRPEQARRYSELALEQAEKLGHPHTLAYTLTYTAVAYGIRGETASALKWAERAISLASERSYELWRVWSSSLRGWALSELGQPREGLELFQRELERWRAFGIRLGSSYTSSLLTEIHLKLGQTGLGLQTVQAGLAGVKKTGERVYEAELHRLRGELLRARGKAHEARYCFFRALAVARQQEAGTFEVRTSVGLARLLLENGAPEKARRLLERLGERFDLRQDAHDFQAARALLERLTAGTEMEEPAGV
ncbi:protein kinase [Archangium violaceum]|uniref:protein kinase domain-containing protein n=1 Tax=Archangium violaceum TaxID=83451 RepID=UPI00195289E0|nr:protein kinase [Archangium violaceum]QRO01222.1 protein kinase [Archangium violaceum]